MVFKTAASTAAFAVHDLANGEDGTLDSCVSESREEGRDVA